MEFIKDIEKLDFVKDVSKPENYKSFNSYYGMNVSPSLFLEPIDQLDGFLVAKLIQKETNSNFFPFIAGCYEVFNSKFPEDAILTAKSKSRADNAKKELLRNIMSNLCLKGEVYITSDLWEDGNYWDIFRDVVSRLDLSEIEKRVPSSNPGMIMKYFPKQILGKMQGVIVDGLTDDWSSSAIYIPAEVAEAVWFKENLGVSFKIGPKSSESIYDDIISEYGMGIIGLTQPEYMEKAKVDEKGNFVPAKIAKTVPYIGKRNQNRVTFSDTIVDISMFKMPGENPSFQRALSLAKCYESLNGGGKRYSDPVMVYELVKLGRCYK